MCYNQNVRCERSGLKGGIKSMNERKTFDEQFAPIVNEYNQEEDPIRRIDIVTKFGFSIMISLVEMGMTVDEVMHDLKLFIKSKEEFEKNQN